MANSETQKGKKVSQSILKGEWTASNAILNTGHRILNAFSSKLNIGEIKLKANNLRLYGKSRLTIPKDTQSLDYSNQTQHVGALLR